MCVIVVVAMTCVFYSSRPCCSQVEQFMMDLTKIPKAKNRVLALVTQEKFGVRSGEIRDKLSLMSTAINLVRLQFQP